MKAASTQPVPGSLLAGSIRAVLLEPPTGAQAGILGIDPGGTTGVALTLRSGAWLVAELSDLPDLWALLLAYRPPTILFERFDPQALPVDLQALDVHGVVKLWCLLNNRMMLEQPRDVKNLCSDRFLRENGLWVRGMVHGRDAIRHLCWHLIKRESNTELLEWTRHDR